MAQTVKAEIAPADDLVSELREFRALMAKTSTARPKESDLAALGRWLDSHSDIWRRVTGLAVLNQRQLIEKIVGEAGHQEMLGRECNAIRKDLGYHDASTLEQMLIQRVVMCWLRLQWVEFQVTGTMRSETSYKQAEHWDKRLTQAHKRFARSCESLARIRRLTQPLRPVVPMIQADLPSIGEVAARGLRRTRERLQSGG